MEGRVKCRPRRCSRKTVPRAPRDGYPKSSLLESLGWPVSRVQYDGGTGQPPAGSDHSSRKPWSVVRLLKPVSSWRVSLRHGRFALEKKSDISRGLPRPSGPVARCPAFFRELLGNALTLSSITPYLLHACRIDSSLTSVLAVGLQAQHGEAESNSFCSTLLICTST